MRRQDIRLLAQARQGDLRARCEVGRRYLLGVDGFMRHVPTGLDHLRQAARQDPATAARLLAESLPLHELLNAGEHASLARAAADGSALAQLRLGVALCAEGLDEGPRWLARAAAAGHAGAATVQAAVNDAAAGRQPRAALQALAACDEVDAQAVALWAARRAREAGQAGRLAAALDAAHALTPPGNTMPEALAEDLVALVLMLRDGDRPWDSLSGIDTGALREALEQRANQGDRDAAFVLAQALCGLPVPGLPARVFAEHQNVRKGAAFMLRAADAGEDEAWLHLYRLHADHSLSVANPPMARFFLEKAALRGQAEAQRKLGALVLRGSATLAETEQAIGWLHEAGQQDDQHAHTLLRSLVLPVAGSDAEAEWALGLVQEQDPGLAARLALARAFGLTKLEALSVDPVQGLRPWGLVVGRNPFIVQARLSAPRAIPALDAAALAAAQRAASLFRQLPAEGDLRIRSLRQRRLFERLGVDEELFFADASAMQLESLRLGPKWAHRTRESLSHALAA